MPKQHVTLDGHTVETEGGWRGFHGVPVGHHTLRIEDGDTWYDCECDVTDEYRRSVWVYNATSHKLEPADEDTTEFFQDIQMNHVLTPYPRED
jgi:hypothetical protein